MPNELFLPLAALALFPLLGSGSRRAVGWGIVGAFLLILGVAAAIPDWTGLADAPTSFVAVSAGLAWLGIGCLAFGGWTASRGKDEFVIARLGSVGANLGITLSALVAAFIIYSIWSLLYAGSWRGVLAAAGLGASGVVLSALLPKLRVATAIGWLDAHWLAPPRRVPAPISARAARIAQGVGLTTLVVVLFTPRLFAFTASAIVVTVAAYVLARGVGKTPRVPVQGILTTVSLVVFLWFVWTIAGSEIALSFPGILDAPFSDAAEAALALILGLGAWVLLGLWPFHGAGPGSALALVGGAFLIRWGVGLIPGGMTHAAPIFATVAGVAVIHAAATGRVAEYAAALGVLAVVGSGVGAWSLFTLASLLATLRLFDVTIPISGIDRRQLGGIALIPILAWALPTMLTGETFVTVVAVFAGVALFRPALDAR